MIEIFFFSDQYIKETGLKGVVYDKKNHEAAFSGFGNVLTAQHTGICVKRCQYSKGG